MIFQEKELYIWPHFSALCIIVCFPLLNEICFHGFARTPEFFSFLLMLLMLPWIFFNLSHHQNKGKTWWWCERINIVFIKKQYSSRTCIGWKYMLFRFGKKSVKGTKFSKISFLRGITVVENCCILVICCNRILFSNLKVSSTVVSYILFSNTTAFYMLK